MESLFYPKSRFIEPEKYFHFSAIIFFLAVNKSFGSSLEIVFLLYF